MYQYINTIGHPRLSVNWCSLAIGQSQIESQQYEHRRPGVALAAAPAFGRAFGGRWLSELREVVVDLLNREIEQLRPGPDLHKYLRPELAKGPTGDSTHHRFGGGQPTVRRGRGTNDSRPGRAPSEQFSYAGAGPAGDCRVLPVPGVGPPLKSGAHDIDLQQFLLQCALHV